MSFSRWRSLIDGTEVDVRPDIPDSEANQKLIHRWYLSEDSDPFVDQIGSADGTNNGTAQVTGDWVDGAARQGDGTDDSIETTTWGDFGSQVLGGDFAVAFSFETTDGDGSFLGEFSGNNMRFDIAMGDFAPSGHIQFEIRDTQQATERIETDSNYDDGSTFRCVCNMTGGSASDMEIWLNQSEVSTSVDIEQGFSDPADFQDPVNLFDGPTGHLATIMDDVCVFDSSLTQSEIESYQNPWS